MYITPPTIAMADTTPKAIDQTNGDVSVVTSAKCLAQIGPIGTGADEVYPAVAAYNASAVVTFYTRAYDERHRSRLRVRRREWTGLAQE
jgi:hypothetical protein